MTTHYRTAVYYDTSKVVGIDATAEDANYTDFTTYLSQTILVAQHPEAVDATVDVSYSAFKALIDGTILKWSQVLRIDDGSSGYTLVLHSPPINPLAGDGTMYVRQTEKYVGKTMKFEGFEFTGTAGTTTKYQWKITSSTFEIVGALCLVTGGEIGDKLQFKVVDVDNVLGYGAGLVLSWIGRNIPAVALSTPMRVESASALAVAANFYLEISYDNAGATDKTISGGFKYFS